MRELLTEEIRSCPCPGQRRVKSEAKPGKSGGGRKSFKNFISHYLILSSTGNKINEIKFINQKK